MTATVCVDGAAVNMFRGCKAVVTHSASLRTKLLCTQGRIGIEHSQHPFAVTFLWERGGDQKITW